MFYLVLTYLGWPVLRALARGRRREGPRRFLVVQAAKIGDLVYATPLWRAIKAAHPDAHVALLAHPRGAPLVAADPALDAIHTVDAAGLRGLRGKWRLASRLRRGRYDVALCLTPGAGLAVALLWGLVPRVVLLVPDVAGTTFRALARLAHRAGHRRGEPLSAAYARVAAAAGVGGDTRARSLAPPPGAAARVGAFLESRGVAPGTLLVGIAPATGNPVKQWPAARVAALADRLGVPGRARVVFVGSGVDRALAEAIVSKLRAPEAALDAVGAFPLEDLPALIGRLALLVAADSGPLHVAEAVGVPAVVVGGPADLRERDLRTPHLLVQRDLPCVPCVSAFAAPYACPLGHHRCIEETEVDQVWKAVQGMLDRLAAPAAATVHGPGSRVPGPGSSLPGDDRFDAGRGTRDPGRQ